MASESNMAGHDVAVDEAEADLQQAPELAGVKQSLDEISRQLKELDKRWIAKWAPQDLAIKNHERRIKALENRRPR